MPTPLALFPRILVGSSLLALGACGTGYRPDLAMEYPSGVTRAGEADIQVYRRETKILLANSSSRDFSGKRLWLNQEFSRVVERFAPGETIEFSLNDFYNEYGEPFRAGGFFATEPPSDLVKAEFELPDGWIALAVVNGTVESGEQGLSARRRERETRR